MSYAKAHPFDYYNPKSPANNAKFRKIKNFRCPKDYVQRIDCVTRVNGITVHFRRLIQHYKQAHIQF